MLGLNFRAQGAMEYLLIIGAAILVIAIVILAVTGVLSGGQTQIVQSGESQDASRFGLVDAKDLARGISTERTDVEGGETSITLSLIPESGNALDAFANAPVGTKLIIDGNTYTKTADGWVPPYAPPFSGEVIVITPPASGGFQVVEKGTPPGPPTPRVSISSPSAIVAEGDSVTITWSASGVSSCVASGGSAGWAESVSGQALQGSFSTNPLDSNVYSFNIDCSGDYGPASASVSVEAKLPSVVFSVEPLSAASGDTVTIKWNPSYSNFCYLSYPSAFRTSSGFVSEQDGEHAVQSGPLPPGQHTYGVICGDLNYYESFARGRATVSIEGATVSMSALTYNVLKGKPTTITWTPSKAVSCVAAGGTPGWAGSVSASDGSHTYTTPVFESVGLSYDFNIECAGSVGVPAKASITVKSVANFDQYGWSPDQGVAMTYAGAGAFCAGIGGGIPSLNSLWGAIQNIPGYQIGGGFTRGRGYWSTVQYYTEQHKYIAYIGGMAIVDVSTPYFFRCVR